MSGDLTFSCNFAWIFARIILVIRIGAISIFSYFVFCLISTSSCDHTGKSVLVTEALVVFLYQLSLPLADMIFTMGSLVWSLTGTDNKVCSKDLIW